jgi:hypothetical protein
MDNTAFIGVDDDDDKHAKFGDSGCTYVCKRLCAGEGEDGDDVCRKASWCGCGIVTWLMCLVAFVLGIVAVAQLGGLAGMYASSQNVRTYAVAGSGGGLVPDASAFGMIQFDRARRLVSLNLVVYALPNRTSMNLYGPRRPGPLETMDIAIPLTYEAAPSGGAYYGSESIHVRVPVLDSNDIALIFAQPSLYYVGLSTSTHSHGTALQATITGELSSDAEIF